MSKSIHEIASIPLGGTQNGMIEIAVLSEPYGTRSDPVASIGIFLSGGSDAPDWKVHLPKENIAAVIAALQEAQEAL